ncbi:hypothetical protein Metho_1597 [Methanomethylovorans hollandica DSM 15978]|uniref:Uncharacterized protein n=1 Tax=Methanomethylovorans hollandica (strain DSM 15978 / NBRC 107637 / DMS1) TaxID=867904 RepID=L0L0B6_METHD|nr:hypothetical protein [Methanomethylovorans hollandica]AGB49793.1 hypothetical protein Metho_1597 [Methanomethylovorans hollandica DSM 15978]
MSYSGNAVKSKRNQIYIGVLIVLFLALTAVAASGLVHIPLLTQLLGTDEAKDLGVEVDPMLFDQMIEENGIDLKSPVSAYQLTSDIQYSDPAPLDITLSSSQLSSYLQATNNEGAIKQIQIKLGDNNEAEMSAYVDLQDHGYDFKGPVYASGRFEKDSDATTRLAIYKAKVGMLPIPGSAEDKGEEAFEDLINSNLAKMPGLNIKTLKIEDGQMHFEGDFPQTMEVV